MYRYKIGEDSYEDYRSFEVLHEKQFTEKEFLSICREAFKKLDQNIKNKIADSRNCTGSQYVVEILISDYGFIKANKVIETVHLCQLHNMDKVNCEYCTHSYFVNNQFQCNSSDCEYKDL